MLRDLNKNLLIAPNFQYKEFVRSSTADRLGIKNEPTDSQWQSIERVAENIIQPIRNEVGPIRITSGFRCVELCLAVGSSASSNHARGEAIDFEPVDSKIQLIDIIESIYKNLDFRELIAEYFPNGWVHVAYRKNENVKNLKLKDKNHNYTQVTISSLLDLYKI